MPCLRLQEKKKLGQGTRQAGPGWACLRAQWHKSSCPVGASGSTGNLHRTSCTLRRQPHLVTSQEHVAPPHSPATRGARSEVPPSLCGSNGPRQGAKSRTPRVSPANSRNHKRRPRRRHTTPETSAASAPPHAPRARAPFGHRPRPRHRRPPPRPPRGKARPRPPPRPRHRGPAARSPSRWPRPCSRSPWPSWSAPASAASTGARLPPWRRRAARCAPRILRSAGEVRLFVVVWVWVWL